MDQIFKSAKIIDKLYKNIIPAGTIMASSIKVAEAAKVIENTQRDINIAFIKMSYQCFLTNLDWIHQKFYQLQK